MYCVVDQCRCCGTEDLQEYLNLGDQPLANAYHHGEKQQKRFPLRVNLCKICFHSQLSVLIDPNEMFRNYLYITGTSQTFRKHCQNLARNAYDRHHYGKPRVLDIACNDGTLLECFHELGCEVMGIDPARNLRQVTKEKEIPVLVDYWQAGSSKKIPGKFAIITATNIFAHVDNPIEFLKECQKALELNGLIILEFPYCNHMIKRNEFDTIYHEHLSYFLVNSFLTLIDQIDGLYISDVIETPIHGGSIRFFIRHDNQEHCRKVQLLINKEEASGLLSLYKYSRFADRVLQNQRDLSDLLKQLKKDGEKIIGYGASAKGNTMLNCLDLDNETISYIIDDTPLKWGYLTPGQDILITSISALRTEQSPVHILMLAWNFSEEIIQKVYKASMCSHKFIYYVPKVHIKS